MKVKGLKGKNFQLVLAMVALVAMSGCQWFGGSKDEVVPAIPSVEGGQANDLAVGVLAAWGDGTPLVTQKEFDERLGMIIKQKPELKDMPEAYMPMIKAQLFTGLLYTKLIGKWVKENKIDLKPEYKKMLDQLMDEVKIHINTTFFSKEIVSEPSESEVKDYFEKNKDRIALISRGGVKAVGVKFEDPKEAESFLAKAKVKVADFNKIIKADPKLKDSMQDFHLVNKQSRGIDKTLVKKILEIKKFPAVEMIKVGDKNIWVVNAIEKEKEAYKPYKEVRETIFAMVKQAKQGEATQKKLEELKAKYGVKVKEKAFMPPEQQKPPVMPQVKPASKKAKRGKKVADVQEAQPLAPATKAA